MDDKAFLKYALKQSFFCPIINSSEGLSMQHSHDTQEYVFHDMRRRNLIKYSLPLQHINKYLKDIDADTRRLSGLYAEYELYKHDVRENIIIPEEYPEIAQIRKLYDLQTVNRQSAQKKRICARIMPADFSAKLQNIHNKYRQTIQNTELYLAMNPKSVNLSLINDFAATYHKVMRSFKPTYPLFWLNKKRMNYYLNEAAQILKASCPLPADFDETHRFIGENSRIFKKSAQKCQTELRLLIAMIGQMAHEIPLLNMVQTLLADQQKYTNFFNAYRKEHSISDVTKISAARHGAQKLFECYAFLVYLDGVRFAFENKYLSECPEPRQPALPTVAPQEELKKVVKIVNESYKLSAADSKIAQIYNRALQDYESAANTLEKLIIPA